LNFKGIRFHAHPLNIEGTFLLGQYRYSPAEIGVDPGDVVIDGGGCWGDTALYFAERAQHVFCFECMPSNIEILEGNLRMNPALARKISVIPKALWNVSRQKLAFEDRGPASMAASGGPNIEVETQTIDDFVQENSIRKVNFIKMDIEGSEPQAIIGAEETIRRHRPKLAIAIYHDLRHFATIPNWINGLSIGYRFYVDHFTIHTEETILFARAEASSS
jgi:FkbM family methyltransferase